MKKLLCVLSLLAIVAVTGQAMAYSVSLTPATQTIGPGGIATVNVDLALTPAEVLNGFNLAFSFNSSTVALTSFASPLLGVANVVQDPSQYTADFVNYIGGVTYLANIDADNVYFNGFLVPPAPPLTGAFTLASLTFTGTTLGQSTFNLTGDLDLGNPLLDPVDAFGAVTGDVNVTPEPGTFLLLGLGLAGLVGYRRKFRKE